MSERFQVDLAGMVDLLSRHLYSGPEAYLRELIQNAVDAVTARLAVDPDAEARIRLSTDVDEQGRSVLQVTDTGIGLTAAEASELLATIGRSSKRDTQFGLGRTEFIGQFGIGLGSPVKGDQVRVLLIPGDFQAIAAGDLMHVPNAGPEVAELEEGFPHEARADAFKLVARSLARDAFADGFSFEQIGNALGNRLARRVAAVRVADHPGAVDGQG